MDASIEQRSGPAGRAIAQRFGFWMGLALLAGLLAMPLPEGMSGQAKRAAAVTALVACWWMSEAAPLPATSLLPLVLLPLLGVLSSTQVAAAYANKYIFLFLGGFILALGLERWDLHRRIALYVLLLAGTGRRRVIFGFMLASGLLSMWISNTATTLMLLPIGMAVIGTLNEAHAEGRRVASAGRRSEFPAAVMLGIAYGASIGGIATPIGTPPNIAFGGIVSETFPGAVVPSFGRWMLMFLPLSVLMLVLAWVVLVLLFGRGDDKTLQVAGASLRQQLRDLGPMSQAQKAMLAIFAVTAAGWVTRTGIRIGTHEMPGWPDLLGRVWPEVIQPKYIHDATIAVAAAVLCFLVPAGRDPAGRRSFLMDWNTAKRLPWDILLLFGGGFAIAEAFRVTGLSRWLGGCLAAAPVASAFGVLVLVCLFMTFLTELTSNTATTQVMLPILAGASIAMKLHPYWLMLPATLSASCAFMLPVATPPNAIVFGSGRVQMRHMLLAGICLNFLGVVLIAGWFWVVASSVLGIDPGRMPPWATSIPAGP